MNKKLKLALIISILAFLACVAVYAFVPEENGLLTQVADFIFIIAAASAGISALFTFRTTGWESKDGKVWFLMGLGFLGWAAGEFLWMYNELILKINPFPSTADIAYVLAYAPMVIGLWIEYNVVRDAVQKKSIIKSVILIAAASAISAYLVLLPVATAIDFGFLSKVTSLAYPVGDLVILFFALVFIFTFKGAKMAKSWLLVAMALGFMAVADTSFAYLDWNELYAGLSSTFTDLGWLAGYILFAFAAYYHKLIMNGEA